MTPSLSRATLFYVHDPMCSWCWAFGPVLETLLSRLPEGVRVERLLGGLAPDTDEPMPESMRNYLQATWAEIQRRVPGTRFNFDFWSECRPRRTTYPACRAVIAARRQGEGFDTKMTRAIQEAYYLHARNPSDDETLTQLAGELGLDRERFADDLNSAATRDCFAREMGRAREMDVESYPALVIETANGPCLVPIDYLDSEPMLKVIRAALGASQG